jgi:hypothetical protein
MLVECGFPIDGPAPLAAGRKTKKENETESQEKIVTTQSQQRVQPY